MEPQKTQQDRIRELFASQRLAVLATQQEQSPYASVVAFVVSDDLRELYFVTGRPTQKFRNAVTNPMTALLIDNRTNSEVDFHAAVAVTALGMVAEVVEGDALLRLRELFLGRHPYLEEFFDAPSTALMRVNVERYLWVDHFQHVVEVDMRS